mgnify:CR=1 FL=1
MTTPTPLSDTAKGAGIRSGAQYLEGLRDGREVWIHGERVEDVTNHPGVSRGAHTLASFLDRQFDPALVHQCLIA